MILDRDGKRLYNSNSYNDILGEPSELKGTDSFKEIHEEDREKIKNIFQETVKTGVGQRSQYRFIAKDGSIRFIESQGKVIKNARKEVCGVVVISRDITEGKNIKRALSDSEERMNSILKAIPDIIYRLDAEGKITFISEAIRGYGYEADEIIGKNIFDLVHPDDRQKAIYRVNERRTGSRRTKSFEIRLMTTSGKSVVVDNRSETVHLNPVFLLEAEGLYTSEHPEKRNFLGTQGIARDITDRKKTEEENTMLAQALKCVSECVSVTDLNNKIIFVNDAFLNKYGYERRELLGKPISIVRDQAPDSGSPDEILHESKLGGWKGEVLNRAKSGQEFPINLSTSIIYDTTGVPIALIGVATDISEKKRLETQLQQSQKLEAIGKLAGGVAHDFNNLLTVIQGYAEMLLLRLEPESPQADQVRQINHAAERAESLTKQLLAFSRKQIMQPKVIDLNLLLENIKDMLERLIGADVEFKVIEASDLGKIKADPGQVEQVIMNLVVNSRDAMKQGGKLSVETKNSFIDEQYKSQYPEAAVGQYVELKITDTGTGMDKDTQTHIFEPFFTTKLKGEGTGLGLATVYGIVKQSGGYIYVKSELNKGTTFSIYFPRVDKNLDIETPSESTTVSVYGDETILIAEDQPEVRNLMVGALKMYGYNVIEAQNGEEALEVCNGYEGKIDLIITDIVMPKMSGQKLMEKLNPLNPDMKVIFISGYSEEVFSNKSELIPGSNFVQKPFTPHDILIKVREILG
ncbi:MAG: PAS domain-containing sensor histidine kinase [Calditrichales bacterium]|nr:MAG: PAS domain-containing sensor histidine kinase [Calditrichales bacterium]